jgi:hypothetical protein
LESVLNPKSQTPNPILFRWRASQLESVLNPKPQTFQVESVTVEARQDDGMGAGVEAM